MLPMDIAKICYEAKKIYCWSLHDYSAKDWRDASTSAIQNIYEDTRFWLNNPKLTCQEAHASWIAARTEEGWKYSEETDVGNKESMLMKPFDELPESCRKKELLVKAIVDALR